MFAPGIRPSLVPCVLAMPSASLAPFGPDLVDVGSLDGLLRRAVSESDGLVVADHAVLLLGQETSLGLRHAALLLERSLNLHTTTPAAAERQRPAAARCGRDQQQRPCRRGGSDAYLLSHVCRGGCGGAELGNRKTLSRAQKRTSAEETRTGKEQRSHGENLRNDKQYYYHDVDSMELILHPLLLTINA